MYIISTDLGTTNYKAIVMKVYGDTISLVGKIKKPNMDYNSFISIVLNEYNIKEEEIEMIIATGTGSSYIKDDIICGKKPLMIDEFDAVGYGGLILAKLEEAIVVSIGTGTSFVYSNMVKNVHIGGTGLGGGTFVGLSRKFFKDTLNFKELVDFAKKGDRKKVDLTIADINNGDIDNLTSDITAANIATISDKAKNEDYVAGIANMIFENIGLLVHAYNKDNLPIVFIGTMVTDSYMHSVLERIGEFTGDNYVFVENADYAIAIGAYEYYLLRLRKVV